MTPAEIAFHRGLATSVKTGGLTVNAARELAFAYESCDVDPGVTLREWRTVHCARRASRWERARARRRAYRTSALWGVT